MKMFILALLIPIGLFSGEVNEAKFLYLIDSEIKDINDALSILTDPRDIYMAYWLTGQRDAYVTAKRYFNNCCECHSGCP